jgi:predicted HTH transcriptional regulator
MAIHDSNGKITKPQISNIIAQGKTSVDNHIAQLRKLGLLNRVGSDKSGQWVINMIPPPESLPGQ